MPVQILIDLSKLKILYSGLGHFSYYFGHYLSDKQIPDIRWKFLIPGDYARQFGDGVSCEKISLGRRLFPRLYPSYHIWHAIHQDSSYFPGTSNTPYILTIHDLNFLYEKDTIKARNRLSRLQQKVNRACYITFISNFTAEVAHQHLNLSGKPKKVIHNGVDIDTEKEVYPPRFLKQGKFLFALGMILEKKNFHVLLGMMEQLEGFHLVMAGDKSSSYARKIENDIIKRKLQDRVCLPGIITMDEKIYLFKNCEAFLFPSLHEGFGLPVIEAMRFGKPVFISTCSSLPEVGGELAYYLESFDPGYMAKTVKEKLQEYSMNRKELSDKIRSYSFKFNWGKSIHEYVQIYQQIIQETVGPKVKGRIGSPDAQIKVLHLSSEKSWRGGEQQIAYLIEELNKKPVHNLVACQKGSRFQELCVSKGYEHFDLEFTTIGLFPSAVKIASICRAKNIDFVHCHTSKSHTAGILSTLFGHRAEIVLTRRVDFPIRKNIFTNWKYNNPRLKRIITVSDKIKEILKPALNDIRTCITVHSGIDISRFTREEKTGFLRNHYTIPHDHLVIGNTSALADHKDYPTFIRTCRWLTDQGIRSTFFIIGEGPERENIITLINNYRLEDHFYLTGHIQDIPAAIMDLDIFLMTSKTEGLGTSILDAFACRIPVVATRAGGIPEMVKDGITGLLSEIGDFAGLGNNIIQLKNDPELRNKLIHNAYELVSTQFTKEITAHKVYTIYQTLLNEQV